jgi:hypothetical protein
MASLFIHPLHISRIEKMSAKYDVKFKFLAIHLLYDEDRHLGEEKILIFESLG